MGDGIIDNFDSWKTFQDLFGFSGFVLGDLFLLVWSDNADKTGKDDIEFVV